MRLSDKIKIADAILAQKRGDWESAARLYGAHYRGRSDMPGADLAWRYGNALVNAEQYHKAVEPLSRAAQQNPGDATRWYRLGFVQERLNQNEDAIVSYDKAIELDPGEAKYLYRRARTHQAVKQSESAISDAELALVLTPDDPRLHTIRRVESTSLPLWRRFEILEAGLPYFPGDLIWIRSHAFAAFQMRRWEASARSYDEIVGLKGADWKDAIRGYVAARHSGIATKHDMAAVAVRNNGSKEAHAAGVGYLLEQMGFRAEAVDAFTTAIDKTNAGANIYYGRGMAHLRLYNWAEAAEDLRHAAAFDPKNKEYNYRLGYALERMGNYSEAALAYRESINSPALASYRRYRAVFSHHLAGEDVLAVELFAELAKANAAANTAEIAADAAECGEALQEDAFMKPDVSGALEEYHRRNEDSALSGAFMKRDVSTYAFLSKKAEARGELERALELIEKGAKWSPIHKPDHYLAASRIRAKLGDAKGAVEAYLNVRVLRRPFGVDENHVLKTRAQKEIAKYIEYSECLPVDESTWLFESNHGSAITCNVLPLLEEVLRDPRFKGSTFVVVLNSAPAPSHLAADSRVVFAPRGSDLYLRHLATAKWLVNNNTFPLYFIRREEQRYLNTWHGTPLKTLGKHIRGGKMDHRNAARNFLHATHIAAPDAYTARILTDDYDVAHLYSGKVAITGSPRVDATISAVESRSEIRKRLGVPEDGRPILFYAPTWRGDLANREVDVNGIVDALQAMQVADRYHVVFRGHPMDEAALEEFALDGVIQADKSVSTNEILAAVDLLITDYSSVIFDFIPLGKPAAFYTYDIDDYREKRGFALEPSAVSTNVFGDPESLVEGIRDISDGTRGDGWIDPMRAELVAHEDGSAAPRALSFFLEDQKYAAEVLDLSDQRHKREVLFYQGSFMPNGITASFLALTNHLVNAGVGVTVVVEPDALYSEEQRVQRFESMDSKVRVIARAGGQSVTAEERWVIDRFNSLHEFSSPEFEMTYWKAFEREAKRIFGSAHFDVAVCFEGYARFWMGLFPGVSATRHGAYLHNDMLGEAYTRFPYLYGVANQYPKYSTLASVSESVHEVNREAVPRVADVDEDRFVTVPNVTDATRTVTLSQETLDDDIAAWIRTDVKTFVNVGRLSPEKGQAKLIEAFARALEDGLDAQLMIVGQGPLRESLASNARRLGLNNSNFFLAGYRENPFPAMRAADAFVLSSDYEGQGLVVLEALALGLTAVSTDVVGPHSILEGGEGLLVENSVAGLVEGMSMVAKGWTAEKLFDFDSYLIEATSNFAAAFGVDVERL